MDKILKNKSEKIKNSIKDTAEKSKETIREIIDSNTQFISTSIDSNKKMFDSISGKVKQEVIADSVTGTVKQTFGKSIEFAEDALDKIIDACIRQMELNVDFNTKLVDAVKESQSKNPEKMLQLIRENYIASRQLTVKNTKEILDIYNKHTDFAMNFNQKFGENIYAQIESLFNVQSK